MSGNLWFQMQKKNVFVFLNHATQIKKTIFITLGKICAPALNSDKAIGIYPT